LPGWPWIRKKHRARPEGDAGSAHLNLARESLTDLIDDARLPDGIRESLAHDYAAVEAMLDKLQHGHLHIAAFGRVSTGKSSLLNALIGENKFATSPLHGETRHSSMTPWAEVEAGGVFLIDTPGLDEAGGEERESLAKEVAERSDLVIFVLDSDITDSELFSLRTLLEQGRPVVIALNKIDLYTSEELASLLRSIEEKVSGLVQAADIIAVAAEPRPQTIVEIDNNGNETTSSREREISVDALKLRLWDIFEAEGKTLAALNASLFAADLSDQVGRRILQARRKIGDKLVRSYCVAKHGDASVPCLRFTHKQKRSWLTRASHRSRSCSIDGHRLGTAFRVECAKGWYSRSLDRRYSGCTRRGRLLQYVCGRQNCRKVPRGRQVLG